MASLPPGTRWKVWIGSRKQQRKGVFPGIKNAGKDGATDARKTPKIFSGPGLNDEVRPRNQSPNHWGRGPKVHWGTNRHRTNFFSRKIDGTKMSSEQAGHQEKKNPNEPEKGIKKAGGGRGKSHR